MTDVDGMFPFMPNSDKIRHDPSTFNNSFMFVLQLFLFEIKKKKEVGN